MTKIRSAGTIRAVRHARWMGRLARLRDAPSIPQPTASSSITAYTDELPPPTEAHTETEQSTDGD